MVVAGGTAPAHGDRVLAADKDVGVVTSAAVSPALHVPVALGYVQRDFVSPGTQVAIVHGDEQLAAKIVETPFVRA
jgi:aminomethyltransferase